MFSLSTSYSNNKYCCVVSGTKAQIARSPSKKRASFNTGRGKERVRTSSEADKHVNRVGDTSKSLASKVAFSPSLDAGLASKNRVIDDL
jgi:hypothetical protein